MASNFLLYLLTGGALGWACIRSRSIARWIEGATRSVERQPREAFVLPPMPPIFTGACVGLGAGIVELNRPLGWAGPGVAVWAGGLCLLGLIDAEKLVLPTRLVWSTTIAGGSLVLVGTWIGGGDPGHLVAVLIGAILVSILFAGWALMTPASIGFGDVRLIFLVALLTGWVGLRPLVFSIGGGCLGCAVFGIGVGLHRHRQGGGGVVRRSTQTVMPLGLFLAAGSVASVAVAR